MKNYVAVIKHGVITVLILDMSETQAKRRVESFLNATTGNSGMMGYVSLKRALYAPVHEYRDLKWIDKRCCNAKRY